LDVGIHFLSVSDPNGLTCQTDPDVRKASRALTNTGCA